MAAASCCKRASRRRSSGADRARALQCLLRHEQHGVDPAGATGLGLERADRFLSRRETLFWVGVSPNRLAENYTRGRLRERPDPHALPPAPLAVGYLCVPADAQFIKALMRGILPAFWAKAVEPFAPVAQMNCAASGEVRH